MALAKWERIPVLELVASGELGGGSTHVLTLASELTDLGIDPYLATAPGPLIEAARGLGVRVFPVDLMRQRWDLRVVADLTRVVRESRARLVHAHGTRAGFLMGLAGFAAQSVVPYVYSLHGLSYRRTSWTKPAFYGAEWIACRGAAEVITVANQDLADLRARGFVPVGRGTYVANALDPAKVACVSQDTARQRLGIGPGFVIGTISRLDGRQKRPLDLIRAIAPLREHKLIIVGDGPQRQEVERLIEEAGLQDRVALLGWRSDTATILAALDVFVLSSAWEGEPLALVEAMASGLPCIATSTSGARELLYGDNGILVGVGAIEELRTRISEIATMSRTERIAIGLRATKSVELRTARRMALSIAAIYRDVVRASG